MAQSVGPCAAGCDTTFVVVLNTTPDAILMEMISNPRKHLFSQSRLKV